IWYQHKLWIDGQLARNKYLTDEITALDAKIKEIEELDRKKAKLLARKEVIEQLQANRSQMVHLFDSLVRTIPDGVALANIKQEGEILTLEGRAQSNARVSNYMRNLEGSGWMTNPDLSIIEAKDEEKTPAAANSSESRALPYVFTLKVKLANPNAPDPEGGTAAATVASANPAVTDIPKPATPTANPATPATPAAPGTTVPPGTKPSPPSAAPAVAPAAAPVDKPAPATQGRPAS
ncbi:MAG TPA: PilN domain-containing protein, partial [Pseudoxanthomonas sp.]|nr:PilN domain-containing protein [Pseudoxanthomonas sp.]